MNRLRVYLRLARLAVVLLLGLALAGFVAVAERLYRHDLMALRQHLTRWFLASLSGALPFEVEVRGELPQGPHLWVGNHVSWTDIPLLGQLLPISFLSKAEVRTWPQLQPHTAKVWKDVGANDPLLQAIFGDTK